MNEILELRVPVLTKREEIQFKTNDFFDNEITLKIYLSKRQKERILKKINNNGNWIFTNRSNGINDKHSIEEMINDIDYAYAVSFGI